MLPVPVKETGTRRDSVSCVKSYNEKSWQEDFNPGRQCPDPLPAHRLQTAFISLQRPQQCKDNVTHSLEKANSFLHSTLMRFLPNASHSSGYLNHSYERHSPCHHGAQTPGQGAATKCSCSHLLSVLWDHRLEAHISGWATSLG